MEDCDGMLCRLEVIYPNRLHIMHVHLVADTLDPGQPGGGGSGIGSFGFVLQAVWTIWLSRRPSGAGQKEVIMYLGIHISIRYME